MPKLRAGRRRTSAAQEDYLKALFRISGGAETVVPNARLAEEMGVSPGSVSEMLGKLATLGFIVHDPYHGARLTPEGLKVAVEMIRHHRLIETYLVRALGYGWDEVHEEADRLEHRSEEHTSELQSHLNLVCRLLLEKKKKKKKTKTKQKQKKKKQKKNKQK